MKRITFSKHAAAQIISRNLSRTWVERVINAPEWIEQDPKDDTLTWRLGAVDEFGGRYLRVVVRETNDRIHVITVCPDRGATKRNARQHL